MPGVWATPCDHDSVQGIFIHRGHAVTFGPELRSRAMSGSMALTEPVSALMSVSPVTIKAEQKLGGANPPGDMLALECHAATGAMLIWVTCDDDICTQIAARVHV